MLATPNASVKNNERNILYACYMTLQKRLKEALVETDLKPAGLARAVGISRASISAWLTGDTQSIRGTNLVRAAAALNVSPEWLATGHGTKHQGATPSARLEREAGAVSVPKLAIKASAGHGVMQPDADYVVGSTQVPMEWIKKNITCTSPKSLRTITAYGDSMSGTFEDGDIVWVDTGVRQIDMDGVYVVQINGDLFIKRFQRRPIEETLWMISDNKGKYEPQIITKNSAMLVNVLGRAVWVWNGKKL